VLIQWVGIFSALVLSVHLYGCETAIECLKKIENKWFFFFYWWGRPEPRLSHFSLWGRLYSDPYFSSPVHSPEALHAQTGEKWPVKFSQAIRLPRNCCVLLHAANLRHGTDGFTSPPKDGMLRIFFFARKIRLPRSGSNPRTWVPVANMLTTTPAKSLAHLFDGWRYSRSPNVNAMCPMTHWSVLNMPVTNSAVSTWFPTNSTWKLKAYKTSWYKAT
jgi:hypothetical protein